MRTTKDTFRISGDLCVCDSKHLTLIPDSDFRESDRHLAFMTFLGIPE